MTTGLALVVGTGPAGSTAAALLARHGVEVLGRMQTSGTSPDRKARHLRTSPCEMNDLPQTFMEPILFKTPCSRGAQSRMSTEYPSQVQDDGGVTITCRDRLSGKDLAIRSKDLVGADGGTSLVAEHPGLSFEGKLGVGGSMNILFRAALLRDVAHRPAVLYWVMQPGADVGGIGMGLVRMVRPGNEWLIRPGLRHQPARAHRRCRPGNPGRAATGRCAGSGDRADQRRHLDSEQLLCHPHAERPRVHHAGCRPPQSTVQ